MGLILEWLRRHGKAGEPSQADTGRDRAEARQAILRRSGRPLMMHSVNMGDQRPFDAPDAEQPTDDASSKPGHNHVFDVTQHPCPDSETSEIT